MKKAKSVKTIDAQVNDLVVRPGFNPRPDGQDRSKLRESMKCGFLMQPIGINERNEIIWGEGRYEIAKELGWKTIRCVVVEDKHPDNPEQQRAYEFFLAMDENSARDEYTPFQRDHAIFLGKDQYLKLHPNTGVGKGMTKQIEDPDEDCYADHVVTRRLFGMTGRRSVDNAIKRGDPSKLCEKVRQLYQDRELKGSVVTKLLSLTLEEQDQIAEELPGLKLKAVTDIIAELKGVGETEGGEAADVDADEEKDGALGVSDSGGTDSGDGEGAAGSGDQVGGHAPVADNGKAGPTTDQSDEPADTKVKDKATPKVTAKALKQSTLVAAKPAVQPVAEKQKDDAPKPLPIVHDIEVVPRETLAWNESAVVKHHDGILDAVNTIYAGLLDEDRKFALDLDKYASSHAHKVIADRLLPIVEPFVPMAQIRAQDDPKDIITSFTKIESMVEEAKYLTDQVLSEVCFQLITKYLTTQIPLLIKNLGDLGELERKLLKRYVSYTYLPDEKKVATKWCSYSYESGTSAKDLGVTISKLKDARRNLVEAGYLVRHDVCHTTKAFEELLKRLPIIFGPDHPIYREWVTPFIVKDKDEDYQRH